MYLLCIRRTCGVGFYSASSPKQQSRDTLTETTVKRYTHRNNSQEIHSPKQQSRDTLTETTVKRYTHRNNSQEIHSPKQQSRDTLTETTVKRYTHQNNSQEIHYAPLVYIIMIPSKPILNSFCLTGEATNITIS